MATTPSLHSLLQHSLVWILVTRTKVKVLWIKYWMHNLHANTNIHVDQHIRMQFKLLKRWNINRFYDKIENLTYEFILAYSPQTHKMLKY